MTDYEIDKIIARFLGWRLPPDFNPDAGISFTPPRDIYPHMDSAAVDKDLWPVGTNLLDASQARDMIKYLLEIE